MGQILDQMDPLLMIDTTLLKLAPITKWYSIGDFPQGIVVLLYSSPDLALGSRLCDLMRTDGLDVDFILDSNLIWAPDPELLSLRRLMDWAHT